MTQFRTTLAWWKTTISRVGPACFVFLLAYPLVIGVSTDSPAPETAPPVTVESSSPGQEGFQPYVETIPGTLVKFEMIPIRGGTFQMADPIQNGAVREVEVQSFWIGKTEVTWDEYDVFTFRLDLTEQQRAAGIDARSRPSKPYGAQDRGFGHHGYPAMGISFFGAEQYCRWLSAKTQKKYRLPTEAEWEYACRAGADVGPLAEAELDKVAWFWENADDKTHPVGKKQPNAWGLFDILGNVGEWCVGLGGVPVLRGGSFDDPAAQVHCQARKEDTPDWDAGDPQFPKGKWWLSDAPFAGFRIVCEVEEGSP